MVASWAAKIITTIMNKISRYQNIEIIEHLASHYVLGCLSEHVMTRVTKLRKNNSVLDQRIIAWQIYLSQLDREAAEQIVPIDVWQQISAQLTEPSQTTTRANYVIFFIIIICLLAIWLIIF